VPEQVLVYSVSGRGPLAVFVLPSDPHVMPQPAFSMGHGPPMRAVKLLRAKGRDVSWPDWAAELAARQPRFESWRMEPVPAGTSASDALDIVRSREAETALTG
jgi:hypothetical protein